MPVEPIHWGKFLMGRPLFNSTRCLSIFVLTAALFVSGLSSLASAAFIFSGNSADGHPVSGMADFTIDAGADTITIELTNTTVTTLDAGELLTGLDFDLDGLTPTLVSDTGIQRTVAGDGSFVDTLTAQDLSWSLTSLGGGSFQLNFHPNAKDSILGPPIAGSYASANPSVRGNPGHNPFVGETAVFVLSVPNLEASTSVSVSAFRFGTALDPAVPEPASIVLAAVALVALVAFGRRR